MNQEQRERVDNIMADARKMIWVTFQREGIHYYPAALDDPKLADVSFLGHPHRHIFHFRVWIQVFHDDRDLEFIQFKRWCESLYQTDGELELDYQSCERISDALYLKIAEKYPELLEPGESNLPMEVESSGDDSSSESDPYYDSSDHESRAGSV